MSKNDKLTITGEISIQDLNNILSCMSLLGNNSSVEKIQAINIKRASLGKTYTINTELAETIQQKYQITFGNDRIVGTIGKNIIFNGHKIPQKTDSFSIHELFVSSKICQVVLNNNPECYFLLSESTFPDFNSIDIKIVDEEDIPALIKKP